MKTIEELKPNTLTYHDGAWWYRLADLYGRSRVDCPKCGKTILGACTVHYEGHVVLSTHPCGTIFKSIRK